MSKQWTEHEIKRLKGMMKQGYTNAEIGEVLGRTSKAIKVKLSVMGYKRPDIYETIIGVQKGKLTILEYNKDKKNIFVNVNVGILNGLMLCMLKIIKLFLVDAITKKS